MKTDFDAVVVGASIAGATCSALLARQGFRILLVDRAVFPRKKICGEGLMPEGVKLLREAGFVSTPESLGAETFSSVDFYLPGGTKLRLNFQEADHSAQGWVVSREILDTRLTERAAREPGITFWEGFTVCAAQTLENRVQVTGTYRDSQCTCTAKVLVGADGIHSRFHTQIPRARAKDLRFALRTLYDSFQGTDDLVQVHCCSEGEAYVAPMGKGCARITLLLSGPLQRSRNTSLSDLYFQKLRSFPGLIEQLKDPHPTKEIESTSPVCLRVRPCHGERLILIGDAAGAVDPITGQGMTIALKDALLASAILKDALASNRLSISALSRYTSQRQAHFQPSFDLAQTLLRISRHTFLAKRAARSLVRNGRLRQKVLSIMAGRSASAQLSVKDKLHLVSGF